jgi:rhomboid protease GluP
MNQYQNPYYMVPQRRPRAWVNGTLIVLNILYFLYLELTGSTEDAYFMLEHGAMYGPFILEEHEYYRLLISIFMHFGINHIVNNMLVLFVLGDNLERALGKVKYLIFYLICGVGANVISLLFEMPSGDWSVGAGASGAIFGVICTSRCPCVLCVYREIFSAMWDMIHREEMFCVCSN